MWFATNGGVYIYDGTTLRNIAEKEGLQSNFVSQIIESKDGNFDFDPKGFKYDGNTVINVTENLLNQNERIGSILEDKTVHFGLMQQT
jgi:hypothetical protein